MLGKLSKLFHKQTNAVYRVGEKPSKREDWPKEWKTVEYKEYPRMKSIELPLAFLPLENMEKVFNNRRSEREFDASKNISLQELSTILHYSAGIKESGMGRFYPSGGGLYPLEVYLGVNRVESIGSGIYHYNIKNHSLEFLCGKRELDDLYSAILYPWAQKSALIFLVTAVWNRNFIKYDDKGYRMVSMEVGHLAQNFNLAAVSLGIKSCNLAGFTNSSADKILDIDKEDESSIYMIAAGK